MRARRNTKRSRHEGADRMKRELIVDFLKKVEQLCANDYDDDELYVRVAEESWDLLHEKYGEMSAEEFTQFCWQPGFRSLFIFATFHDKEFAHAFGKAL